MRLYRGLSKPYRPEEVLERQKVHRSGTDFTDRPDLALSFARGARGTVLVLDVPAELLPDAEPYHRRITEELYSSDGKGPRRFMVWGTFDDLLAAVIPAGELRPQLRGRGLGALSDHDRGALLELCIDERIRRQARLRLPDERCPLGVDEEHPPA